MIFTPCGARVAGERWGLLARPPGAGETRAEFGGYGDGSEMGKPIPGQGMACRNVHPRQVCAHACSSVSSCWGQEEIPAPCAPPSPCPYIAVGTFPEPPLLYSCGEPATSWALAGPQADSLRIVLSSQPGVSCWCGKPSPVQCFLVHSQKYRVGQK